MTLGQLRLLLADVPDSANLALVVEGGAQEVGLEWGEHTVYPMTPLAPGVVVFHVRMVGPSSVSTFTLPVFRPKYY